MSTLVAGGVAVAAGTAVAQPHNPEHESHATPFDELRRDLTARGLELTLTYYGEVFGNPTGGVTTGATYEGRAGILIDIDLDKLVGWTGGTFHASGHQIHGHGLSTRDVNNLMTISGIEAVPATRLFNLWLEQSFGSVGSVRAGKITAGQEMVVSDTANLFVNSTFGWPVILATDLPSGGPAYPLASLGARAKITPVKALTIFAGIFNGDPAGPGDGDPQVRDNHGANSFRIAGPPLAMIEVGYAGVKLGAWRHDGDHGAYAIVDHSLGWSLDGFVRVAICPSDRNLIDRYVDAGVSRTGTFPGRPHDIAGLGVAFARISPAMSGDHEALVELTYQAKLTADVSIQPDVQYVVHPGGSSALPNALVLGLRLSARI